MAQIQTCGFTMDSTKKLIIVPNLGNDDLTIQFFKNNVFQNQMVYSWEELKQDFLLTQEGVQLDVSRENLINLFKNKKWNLLHEENGEYYIGSMFDMKENYPFKNIKAYGIEISCSSPSCRPGKTLYTMKIMI
jgi:hypothetical protein